MITFNSPNNENLYFTCETLHNFVSTLLELRLTNVYYLFYDKICV